MDLRQLEVFVAVAEERSFTRAADRLHVVQSAVSASIRALERELGSALLTRTTRSVRLTDAGTALLPEARIVLRAAVLARDVVEQTKGGLRGTVALGIMQAWASPEASIPALVATFQRDHPDVTISAHHHGGSAQLAQAIRDGAADLGILSLPGPAPGLELTELWAEEMVIGCTPDHRLAGAGRIELSQLAGETFVDGPPSWGTRLAADRVFDRAGIERTVRFEVNETATIVEFARNGAGLALLPRSLAQGLETVELAQPVMFRTLLAVPSHRRSSAAVRALADVIRRTVPAA